MDKRERVLRRSLLGVPSGDVKQLVADVDATARTAADEVRSAEERARASEARVAELEAQLARTREDPPRTTSGTDFQQLLQAVGDQMGRIMHATQEAGSRIIEHARADTGRELEEADRRQREVEAERAELAGWIAELRQSSPALHQGIVEAAEALDRMSGAMNEAEHAVARVFERMADAGAAIPRSHALLSEVAPPEGPEGDVVVDVATPSGDEQGVPEPPVDVSGRVPWALRDGVGSNGSDGESEDVNLESASLGPSGTARRHDDDLAGSRFSGPVADPRIHQ